MCLCRLAPPGMGLIAVAKVRAFQRTAKDARAAVWVANVACCSASAVYAPLTVRRHRPRPSQLVAPTTGQRLEGSRLGRVATSGFCRAYSATYLFVGKPTTRRSTGCYYFVANSYNRLITCRFGAHCFS